MKPGTAVFGGSFYHGAYLKTERKCSEENTHFVRLGTFVFCLSAQTASTQQDILLDNIENLFLQIRIAKTFALKEISKCTMNVKYLACTMFCAISRSHLKS